MEVYSGKEIDKERIQKIKQIAQHRYAKPFYLSSYYNINNVDELAAFHGIDVEDENLILGEDWFLLYENNKEFVKFLEWVALENNEKNIHQAIQMLNVFKTILIENKEKLFYANMRHDTSYMFYKSMLDKKYFEELFHMIGVDNCIGYAPKELNDLIIDMLSFDSVLDNEIFKNNPEYLSMYFTLSGLV